MARTLTVIVKVGRAEVAREPVIVPDGDGTTEVTLRVDARRAAEALADELKGYGVPSEAKFRATAGGSD